MKIVSEIRAALGERWLPQIYEYKIRPLRTRSFELQIPERESEPQIMHTLLGVELKVGRRRFQSPDLATARYLCVFARLGCRKVAVPYDITRISGLADELETAWHQMLLIFEHEIGQVSASAKGRARAAVVRAVRDEIAGIGAGEKMPLFNRSTKQRKN